MRSLLLASFVGVSLAACGHKQTPPPPSAPEPQPKPASVAPAHISENEAQQLCLLQARSKDGAALSDVKIKSSNVVDAGYLTKLTVGSKSRTCIVTPTGDIRSYK